MITRRILAVLTSSALLVISASAHVSARAGADPAGAPWNLHQPAANPT